MKTLTLLAICAVGMAFGQTSQTSKPMIVKGDGVTLAWKSCESKRWIETEAGGMECAEPLDVPAITIKNPKKCSTGNSIIQNEGEIGNVHISNSTVEGEPCEVKKWTCKDKSRILEHDENDPPKYWCRKVQN